MLNLCTNHVSPIFLLPWFAYNNPIFFTCFQLLLIKRDCIEGDSLGNFWIDFASKPTGTPRPELRREAATARVQLPTVKTCQDQRKEEEHPAPCTHSQLSIGCSHATHETNTKMNKADLLDQGCPQPNYPPVNARPLV